MRTAPQSEDRGAAAVELAVVLVCLLVMMLFTAPLALAMRERLRLERVAGGSVRFATAVPDRLRYGSAQRRPTTAEVVAEARRAWAAEGSDPSNLTVSVSRSPSSARPGDLIEVSIATTVDLGPFGSILALVGNPTTTVNMTARAVGRQE
jgi:Flp pilus assembly protein TadG